MKFEINPVMFLVIPGLLLAFGYLRVSSDEGLTITRDMQKQTARFQVQQQLESAGAEAQTQTAISRYNSGACLLTDQLTQGQFFESVPAGSFVCDRYGWTARVDEFGNVADMAYTDNQDAIRRIWGW